MLNTLVFPLITMIKSKAPGHRFCADDRELLEASFSFADILDRNIWHFQYFKIFRHNIRILMHILTRNTVVGVYFKNRELSNGHFVKIFEPLIPRFLHSHPWLGAQPEFVSFSVS